MQRGVRRFAVQGFVKHKTFAAHFSLFSGTRDCVSRNRYYLSGLWSWGRSPSNFGWLEPGPKIFEWWSRSRNLKFEFLFNRHSLWSKPIVQIIQWFLVFNGPNRSWAGSNKFYKLEPVPKILDACYQNYLQTSKIKGVIDCYDALKTFLLINSFKMFDISLYF